MSEYTPTTDKVRETYQNTGDGLEFKRGYLERGEEFDRQLAEVERTASELEEIVGVCSGDEQWAAWRESRAGRAFVIMRVQAAGMAKLIYNFGVHGETTILDGVDDVREISEIWETEGVDVVSVKVDMLDGSVHQINPIQADYRLVP